MSKGGKRPGDPWFSFMMFLGAALALLLAIQQDSAWSLLLVLASLISGFALLPRIAGTRAGSPLRVLSLLAWTMWFLILFLR